MDELVIEDKKYLSSKKAAKLTGYAKDYVGQLCREGKVEARLVGRNWYVLEESIMDHRFGNPEEQKGNLESDASESEPAIEEKKAPEYSWNPPVYTSEPYAELPKTLLEPVVQAVSEIQPENKAEISKNPLSDMQTAWQEWFTKQKEAEKLLPDASEMLLPEEVEKEIPEPIVMTRNREIPEIQEEVEEKTSENREYIEEPVTLHRKEPVYETSFVEQEEETPIFIKREVVAPSPLYRAEERNTFEGEEETYVPVQRTQRAQSTSHSTPRVPKRNIAEPKRERSGLLLKVTILSVAGIFMAITYLAVTMNDSAEVGRGNALTNYLTGVRTIQVQK